MQKSQFVSQVFTLQNYVPSVDLGAFDLNVVPKDNKLVVTTRVYLEKADPNAQFQLVKFGQQFTKLVPQVWNKKAKFISTLPNWTDIELNLQVEVQVVGLNNCHYRIEVQDETTADHAKGPFAMVTEKQYAGPGANPAFAPREAKFGAQATAQQEISSYRSNAIYDLSKTTLVIPIKNSPLQDPVGRQRLEKFAREIKALKVPKKARSSTRPTLSVEGCGPGNHVATAQSAATYLKACGVKNPMSIGGSGDDKSPDGVELKFDNAELKKLFPEKAGSTKSLFRQITVAHEFGHMLGLPDEYLCMHALTADAMENIYALTGSETKTFKGSGMQIADVKQLPDGTINVPHIVKHQGAFVKLCSNANVVPPEFGRMTTSMMSNGMVFHPHHFATVWEALCQATGFDDWRIQVV